MGHSKSLKISAALKNFSELGQNDDGEKCKDVFNIMDCRGVLSGPDANHFGA
jgi:hypothetical protein